MSIRRIFAQAIVRRTAYVLVALVLAWLGVGQAYAQDNHATRAEAYNHAEAGRASYAAYCQTSWGGYGPAGIQTYELRDTSTATVGRVTVFSNCSSVFGPQPAEPRSGTPHDYPVAQRCIPPEQHDMVSGECKDPAAVCLARNEDAPKNTTAIFTGQQCIDGCVYGARSGKTGTASNGSAAIIYGEVGYTGATCTTPSPPPPPPPPDPKETCLSPGSPAAGMTFCVKPDGRHCYETGPSRYVCWQPGETGTKSDGPVQQDRGPGTNPPPATPPPGETLQPGKTQTTTTNTPGGNTITTTTTNTTTINGTNGSGPQGGANQGGDGDDGDQGSAGGGEGCDVPPSCQGDAINCAVLVQVWRNRCSGNGNKTAGGTCSAAGTVEAFSCSGDEILCKQTLLAAEAKCKAEKGRGEIETAAGESTSGEDGNALSGLWGDAGAPVSFDSGMINIGGSVSELFPDVEIEGQAWVVPPEFFDAIERIKFLIIAMCTVVAMFIAGRNI